MTIDEALKVLEMKPPVTEAALGKAYGEAFTIWNPETFTANPGLHAKAEGKMQSINEAYWTIAVWLGIDEVAPENTDASQEAEKEAFTDGVIDQVEPEPVQESPVSVQPPPIPVQESPVSVQPPPIPVQESPVLVQPPPIPVQESPVSVQPPPIPVLFPPGIQPPPIPQPAQIFPVKPVKPAELDTKPASGDLINDKFIIVCCSVVLLGIIGWVVIDKIAGSMKSSPSSSSVETPKEKRLPTSQELEKYNSDLIAAGQGDAGAQARVGNCLMEGVVCPVDLTAAREWLIKAADQGLPEAFHSLGKYYSRGNLVHPTVEAQVALFFYQLSAEKGYRATELMIDIYPQILGQRQLEEVNQWKERYHQLQPEGNAVSNFIQELNNKKLEKNLIALDRLSQRSELDPPPSSGNGAMNANTSEHLPTDDRLESGFMSIAGLRVGRGHLTLKNGFNEDAYVKLIENGQLKVVLYVKGGEEFQFTNIPDGNYTVLYSLGYGWDKKRRDFNRGRKARKFDTTLLYTTVVEGNQETVATYALTLHQTIHGKASTSQISEDEFDQY